MNESVLKEFRTIPGVGIETAKDLWNLGIRSINQLKDEDPEELYERLCIFQGKRVDRCNLYVYRCAVYFLNEPNPDIEKLKWWNWKDKK